MEFSPIPARLSSPDPIGGRRLMPRGNGPAVEPNALNGSIIVPPGFYARFGRVAAAYGRAARRAERHRRRLDRTIGRREAEDRFLRDLASEGEAFRKFYRAEDRLAKLLRRLTDGRRAALPGRSPDGLAPRFGWAEARWGGTVFGLSDDGRTVCTRPASLMVDLDEPPAPTNDRR